MKLLCIIARYASLTFFLFVHIKLLLSDNFKNTFIPILKLDVIYKFSNWNNKWIPLRFEAFLHYKEHKDQVKNIINIQSLKTVKYRGHITTNNTFDHTIDVIFNTKNQKKHITIAVYWDIFEKIYGYSQFKYMNYKIISDKVVI